MVDILQGRRIVRTGRAFVRKFLSRIGEVRRGTGVRQPVSRRQRVWARAGFAILVLALLCSPFPSRAEPSVIDPNSAWLVDGKVALQFFECSDGTCGRVVWLRKYQDAQGRPSRDKRNPNSALRGRPVCGLTIIEGLRPVRPGLWKGGTFYNPHDGQTYSVVAEQTSEDTISARIYIGMPFLGTTKILTRIPREHAEGWC